MEAPGSREVPWGVVAIAGVLVLVLVVGALVLFGLPQLGPQPTPAPVAPSGRTSVVEGDTGRVVPLPALREILIQG